MNKKLLTAGLLCACAIAMGQAERDRRPAHARIDDLQVEIEALKRRVDALEAARQPPPPKDAGAKATMLPIEMPRLANDRVVLSAELVASACREKGARGCSVWEFVVKLTNVSELSIDKIAVEAGSRDANMANIIGHYQRGFGEYHHVPLAPTEAYLWTITAIADSEQTAIQNLKIVVKQIGSVS